MGDYCSKKLSKILYDKHLRDWSSKAFYLVKKDDEGLYDMTEHKNLISGPKDWFPAYRISKVLDFFRNKMQINIYSFANWKEGTWATVIQKACNKDFSGESTDFMMGSVFNPTSWKEAIERGILEVANEVETFKLHAK